jgi:hypothetical protein
VVSGQTWWSLIYNVRLATGAFPHFVLRILDRDDCIVMCYCLARGAEDGSSGKGQSECSFGIQSGVTPPYTAVLLCEFRISCGSNKSWGPWKPVCWLAASTSACFLRSARLQQLQQQAIIARTITTKTTVQITTIEIVSLLKSESDAP